jgi:EmrB/QacA subfamily drug resistance transporter
MMALASDRAEGVGSVADVSSTAESYPARWKVLAGLMLTMGLAAMDTTIVATAIPAVVRDLGDFSLFAWVFSIYVLAQAVTIPIYGKLADLYGRKPVLIVGILIFVAGSMLCGVVWNMPALIVFRGLQGLGAGAIMPMVSTVTGDLYTVEERARIQGWLSSVWGVSAIVGPTLGGLFAEYASWRWIFYINLPIGTLALWIIITCLHERVTRRRHQIDYLGAALLATGAGLLIFGTLQGGVRWPWLSPPSLGVFAAAALALVLLVWRESRAAEPIVPLWVFRRRLLLGANLAGAALGMLAIGLTTFLPTYAQGVLGVDAVVAGLLLAAMSIGWPLASALSGRLYLRIGFRDAALVGASACLVAGLVFALLPASVPIWPTIVGSFVMGAGLGLLSTPILVGVQSVVGWGRRGVVTSATMFTRQLGQAVGAAILGGLANAALADWFRRAPAAIAQQLPDPANAASQVLGDGAASLSTAAVAYVRQGLYLATHQVFVGLTIAALVGIILLLLTPRRFERLRFDEEDDAAATMAPATRSAR